MPTISDSGRSCLCVSTIVSTLRSAIALGQLHRPARRAASLPLSNLYYCSIQDSKMIVLTEELKREIGQVCTLNPA